MNTNEAINELEKRINKILDNPPSEDFFISGGTVRRLYMLRNGIPLNKYDEYCLYKSDLDLFKYEDCNDATQLLCAPLISTNTLQTSNINNNRVSDNKISTITDYTYTSDYGPYTVQVIYLNDKHEGFDLDCCHYYITDKSLEITSNRKTDNFFDTVVDLDYMTLSSLKRLDKYQLFGFNIINKNDIILENIKQPEMY